MSVSYYGIYIGYHPGVDLRYEGLGRQLAAFIKGAEENKRVRFVIVCPSWSQKAILELFISEGVNANTVDIVRPKGQSVILSLYAKYNNYVGQKKLTKKSWHPILKLNEWINFGEVQLLEKLMTVRNLFSFSMYGLLWLFFIPIRLSMQSISILSRAVRRIVRIPEKLNPYVKRIQKILLNPKKSIILSNCYQLIEQKENQLMIELINKMTYVKAWYSPTAFWPYFNQIRAPKLMCVPDVVLTEFPVEFAILGGEPLVQMFKKVETSIKQGEYFVTYSQHIKDSILIEKYGINSEKIKVIPHSANKLDHLITIQGYGAAVDRTRRYSQQLLLSALKKSTYVEYTKNFNNTEVKYLFYASQFRPSKNIITLLRAYKYLLRNHFLGHKLILTGRPDILKEIDEYIDDNLLNYDVILIPQLTVKELAATYHLEIGRAHV